MDVMELRSATLGLADALVKVWDECEKLPYDLGNGVFAGANLAEELSEALAIAARRIVTRGFPSLSDPDNDEHRETFNQLGQEALVKQRPGCWEAAHVRALCGFLELVQDPNEA